MNDLQLATETTRTTYATFNQEQLDAVQYRKDNACETLDQAVEFIAYLIENDMFDE